MWVAWEQCSTHLSCTVSFYFTTVVLYMWTLNVVDRWSIQFAKKNDYVHQPLADLGFHIFPRIDNCIYITDGLGIIGAFFLLRWLFFFDGRTHEATCETFMYAGVGNLLSTSLHSVTIIPSDDFKEGVPCLGGGISDKLMSKYAHPMIA